MQTVVLGELRAQLQALQEQPPGWVNREPMVSMHMPRIPPLPTRSVQAAVASDEGTWELNLAISSRETLYLLQEVVTKEFRAREGHNFHILTE